MIAMSHQESLLLAYCSLYVASPTCKLVFLPSFLFFIGFILSTCYSDRPSINSILKKPFIQKRIEKFLTQDVSSLSLIKMCIHCNSTFMFPLFYWMLWIMTTWGKISEIFSYSCLVSGLLIFCDVAISHNWPQIATFRIICQKSHNSGKIAKFEERTRKNSLLT